MFTHKGLTLAAAAAFLAVALGVDAVSAQRRGRGPQRGRGDEAAFRADRELFHYLVSHRNEIKRTVERLPNGVKAQTESDNPEVAEQIQKHVKSMYDRVKNDRPIRLRDPLFAAVFRHADQIDVKVEDTEKGVKVTETSEDPYVVRLLQAHAGVVSLFLKHGFPEVRRNHAVPSMLEFRIVPNRAGSAREPVVRDLDSYTKDLAENGPLAGRKRGDPLQWFEIEPGLVDDAAQSTYRGRTYVLLCANEPFVMTPGTSGFEDVYLDTGPEGKPAIGFVLDEAGGKMLKSLTEANVKNRLAVVIDGKVVAAPTIRGAISDKGVIAGNFTEREARGIVEALRVGMARGE
jgi:hypothetical protein